MQYIALYFPLNRNYFEHLNHLSSKHTTCTLLSFLKPNHYSASYDKWTKRALFSWHYFLMLFAKQQECLSWPGEEKIKEIRTFLKTGYKAERIIQVINSLWMRGLLQRRSHPDWILIFFIWIWFCSAPVVYTYYIAHNMPFLKTCASVCFSILLLHPHTLV